MTSNFELGPGDWAELRQLLQAALELDPEHRRAWVEDLGPDQERLKPRLLALLEHTGSNSRAAMLDSLPALRFPPICNESDGRKAGDSVGPYRLLRELGRGGMGSVWLAERDDMLSARQVALKLPRLMAPDAQLAERLAREREILAALNHPNIARLYDAGIAADGQPYLALEFVEGKSIDAYCDQAQLDVPARLRLFLQITRAVAHAHANLVVHRDLKPGNILVTESGDARLLDFGIARLLEHGEVRESEFTRTSGRALTPEYSAPEQITGQPVTTAADVYALGVLLFELLTGARPYKLKRQSQVELEEAIVQADIQRPSNAVADPRLKKKLKGDLDVIVLKALRKEPAARYATVDALTEDIERHLARQPVLAQPDKRLYRLRKFVARNRLAVSASGAVLFAVLASAGVSIWQANVARTEQHRAEEVKNFITSLFRDADPFNASAAPTVDGLLRQAQSRLEDQFSGRPELRVELLTVLASGYIGISEFDSAAEVLKQAVDLGTTALGKKHPLTLRARVAMTTVHRFRGELDEMQSELESVVADMKNVSSVSPLDRLLAIENTAHLAIDQGGIADAQAAASEARDLAVKEFGTASPEAANATLLLAVALSFGSDHEQALAASEQALAMVIDVFGSDRPHARVLDARATYGRTLGNLGRYRLAADELATVVREATQLLGPDTPMIGYYAADVSRFELELGNPGKALEYGERSLKVLTSQVQDDTYTMSVARYNVGRAQLAMRRPEAALQILQVSRNGMLESRGADSPVYRNVTAHIALALALLGRVADAQQEIAPEIGRFRNASGLFKFHGLHFAGIVQRLAKDFSLAEALQREAMESLDADPIHVRRRQAVESELVMIALDLGDNATALERVESWPLESLQYPPGAPADADRLLAAGRAFFAAGRPAQALRPLAAADAFWKSFDPGSQWAAEAAHWLAELQPDGDIPDLTY